MRLFCRHKNEISVEVRGQEHRRIHPLDLTLTQKICLSCGRTRTEAVTWDRTQPRLAGLDLPVPPRPKSPARPSVDKDYA